MTMESEVGITMQDVQEMLSQNPLAMEQVKGVALRRQNAALQEQLAELRNGGTEAEEPVDIAGAKKG
jgi:non-canonical (house-cleaning) NTP pyrophosphatase